MSCLRMERGRHKHVRLSEVRHEQQAHAISVRAAKRYVYAGSGLSSTQNSSSEHISKVESLISQGNYKQSAESCDARVPPCDFACSAPSRLQAQAHTAERCAPAKRAQLLRHAAQTLGGRGRTENHQQERKLVGCRHLESCLPRQIKEQNFKQRSAGKQR